MILWRYPADALPEGVEYSVEIEVDVPGLWALVVRDRNDVPQTIGVMTGDDHTDPQTLLALWGLDGPDISNEPPTTGRSRRVAVLVACFVDFHRPAG